MIKQGELLEQVHAYNPCADGKFIQRAYDYGERMHGNQKRFSGEPYFSHPVAVANILAGLHGDLATIVTALLHDTLEDTEATYEEIEQLFGAEVANLVNGVTKLTRLELSSENSAQAENFRKLLLATANDIRVLLVKLADRMHNMRTLNSLEPESKRVRIAQETMDIYAPLAGRIGVQGFREELEDRAFQYLNPEAHGTLKERLQRIRSESGQTIQAIAKQLQDHFVKANINATVNSREKGLYAIWKKMERKSISLEQLCDITGFRIIVPSIEECYRALGIIHCTWQSVPGRFKDYVSTPKANGYQSIQTTVVGPERQRVELQIRTRDMHQVAEYGIAAHWAYKENTSTALAKTMTKQFGWLRQLVEMLERDETPEEFLEHTKLELFQDQVFCFTPKGTLIALPQGATSLDFAYAVHTNIGDTCVGCRINGRHMPLRQTLQNGDEVEIIRSRAQAPMRMWEKIVKTGKARSAIRRALRKHQSEEEAYLGRRLLEAVFEQAGHRLSNPLIERVLATMRKSSAKALCAAVGRGDINAHEVLNAAYPQKENKNGAGKFEQQSSMPAIRGIRPGMTTHFAEGVFPVPGDRIVGIFTPGKGVVIYPIDSPKLRAFDDQPELWNDIEWDTQNNSNAMFVARISLVLLDEIGSLSSITSLIADYGANIVDLRLHRNERSFCDVQADIEIRDLKHLNQIFSALQGLSVIAQLRRISG